MNQNMHHRGFQFQYLFAILVSLVCSSHFVSDLNAQQPSSATPENHSKKTESDPPDQAQSKSTQSNETDLNETKLNETELNETKPAELPEWRVRYDAALEKFQSGTLPDSESAIELLIACYSATEVPIDALRRAEFIFVMATWQVELRSAMENADADAGLWKLKESLTQLETRLIENGVPSAFAQSGRFMIAMFAHNRQQGHKLEIALRDPEMVTAFASPQSLAFLKGAWLNLSGLQAMDQSNYADAFEFFRRSLDVRKQVGMLNDIAESQNNLALLALKLGDFSAARNYVSSSIRLYEIGAGSNGRMLPGERLARLNLAKAIEYGSGGDCRLAAKQLRDLLASSQPSDQLSKFEQDSLRKFSSNCENNLAITLYNLGAFAECQSILEKVNVEFSDNANPADLQVAELNINRGWAALAIGKQDDAVNFFRQSLKQLETHHPGIHRIPEAMSYLARTLVTQNPDEAAQLLNRALDLRETYLFATLSTSLSDRNRLAFLQNLRMHPESIAWPGELDSFLELADALEIPVEERYRRLLVWKGALAQGDSMNRASENQEVKQLESERAQLRRQIFLASRCQVQPVQNNQTDNIPGEDSQATVPKPQSQPISIAELEQRANDLERELRRVQPTRKIEPSTLQPSQLQAALPNDAAFLDIIEYRQFLPREEGEEVYDDRVYAGFLVTREKISWFELGLRDDLEGTLIEFREQLKEGRDSRAAANDLNAIFGSRLLDEIGDAKTLIVAADGRFNQLPWSALPDPGQPEKYWVDRLTVASVSSAQSLMKRLAKRNNSLETDQGVNWITIGGVDYGTSGSEQDWNHLPETAKEATDVDAMLRQSFSLDRPTQSQQVATKLTGIAATKQALLDRLPASNIVHIATHGKFYGEGTNTDAFAVHDATSSLDSALVMSGANIDPTCGFETLLTAEEIGGQDLESVRLVVLSACETGLGHVQAGQGVVGLTGAFGRAGVDSTVASLWKVDDKATQILMGHFYRRLLDDKNPLPVAAALRDAQIKLRDQQGGGFSDPKFWAPWIVVGDPEMKIQH